MYVIIHHQNYVWVCGHVPRISPTWLPICHRFAPQLYSHGFNAVGM